MQKGTYTTKHDSPFDERWGGWYVTGKTETLVHLGNQIYRDDSRSSYGAKQDEKEPPTSVAHFSGDKYLSSHSDVVALLVLGHQTQMHNAIAAANFETRRAVLQSQQMNELLDRPAEFLSDSARRRIDSSATNVVEHLLMSGEVTWESPIRGSSGFAGDFASAGKTDSRGRSLKQLDLRRRLFRYPCSYLIYSDAFEGMPSVLKKRVLEKLHRALDGTDESKAFAHLTSSDRKNIREILLSTHAGFRESEPQ